MLARSALFLLAARSADAICAAVPALLVGVFLDEVVVSVGHAVVAEFA